MATQKPRRSAGCCGVIAVIGVFGIIALVWGIIAAQQRASTLKPFAAYLDEYASIANLQAISGPQEAYANGKVLPLDIDEKEVDDIYFDLPKELVAGKPEEVGTIIWLNWGEVLVGRYTDGAGGYRIVCEVTVIDKTRAAIVGKETFSGSDPPSVKEGSGSRTGSTPTADVLQYISSLPRK